MQALTAFLAGLIGICCALMGAGMLTNRRDSAAAIEAMMRGAQLLPMSGIIALPAGLALALAAAGFRA